MAILNTYCEYNFAVTVASEVCPVIWFLSQMAALPFLNKKKISCIFTGLKQIDHVEDIDIDGSIVLEWILKKQDACMWTGCGRLL
jgi:hypothetical protein